MGPDLCFVVKLKNNEIRGEINPKTKMSQNQKNNLLLNEGFIKTVEMDYAVQYLNKMGMDPTQRNVGDLLARFPLSSCEINTSGWDNTRDTVDTITIYPHKFKKMTFEKHYNMIKNETKKAKGLQSSLDMTEEEELAQEKKKYMEVSGLAAL
jgi:hypothetical protein